MGTKVNYILFEDKVAAIDKFFDPRTDEERIMTITQVIKNEVHGRTKFEIERIKGFGPKKKKGIILFIKNKDAFAILCRRFRGNEFGEVER